MKKVLFVCTGNTCRSPMAEALLRQKAMEEGIRLEVRSAGISAVNGLSPSDAAVQVMKEKGIDHSSHRSRPLDAAMAAWADLILVMTEAHKQMLVHRYPDAVDKLHTLKEYVLEDSQQEKVKSLQRLQVDLETCRALLEQAEKEGDHLRKKELQVQLEGQEASFASLRKEVDEMLSQMNVGDPFGGDEEVYRRCAAEIEVQVEKLLDRWQNERES
ncbi:protein-tyrosine phosphatase [Kroppenstedtia sanguinis]|uniref:low molecular weight protein arginine phosphatase n=1 Tax=Kroppenstedtia sanguinis TaxID=1380684 RepID=UPI003D1FAB11